jgi:hypothetical protein
MENKHTVSKTMISQQSEMNIKELFGEMAINDSTLDDRTRQTFYKIRNLQRLEKHEIIRLSALSKEKLCKLIFLFNENVSLLLDAIDNDSS